MALGFSINTIEFQSIQPKVLYPMKSHPDRSLFKLIHGRILSEYQLLYITRDTGVLKIGSSPFMKISACQAILIQQGKWHFYCSSRETGWDKYSLGFNGDIFENIVADFPKIKNQILSIGLNVELVNLFRRAIEVSKSEDVPFQGYLQGIVLHIIGLIITESQRENNINKYSQQIVEKAKIIMAENVFENLSPVELALKLEMNYVSFRKLFKEATGLAPAKYFMALKIQKAREILANSSLSINKISEKLCFDSPDSFNKAFKKRTGQTGTKYRLNCKKT